ncbi:hypothetical protein LUZ60_005868 [Juncus effusus]|nr:hypothetical protein LUZ60_005868 [Juncus effusus]
MESSTLFPITLLLSLLLPMATLGANSNLFRDYIGALFDGVKFSDVPINPNVEFHFILAFVIDYSVATSTPTPTNGEFGIFFDTTNLSPDAVSSIKQNYSNVKVALSVGGDSVNSDPVYFNATSVDSWVSNAVTSLTSIIQQYNLDGIDIDYEHFSDVNDTSTFTECIGQLITTLKNNGVISFASIAPFADPTVNTMYEALWAKYSTVIDYVNFQFYAYSADTTVDQYVQYYDDQTANYPGGNVLASFTTGNTTTGLSAETGLNACKALKQDDKLYGIFIWAADDSLSEGFTYEIQSQELLAS